MQSASDTPSSRLWALSCPADQRGVGHGSDRRAHPGTKVVAERSHFGDLESQNVSRARRHSCLRRSYSGGVLAASRK